METMFIVFFMIIHRRDITLHRSQLFLCILHAPLGLLLVLLVSSPVLGQVGDVAGVIRPGWQPADNVLPEVNVEVTFDEVQQLWQYRYSLGNQLGAKQDIKAFRIRFETSDQASTSVEAPDGWRGYVLRGGWHAGAAWRANVADPNGDAVEQLLLTPRPAQISAGRSLSGFAITSSQPPGFVRAYVQGFVRIPYVDPERHPDLVTSVPHDTTNAQRGWIVGPTRYRENVIARMEEDGDRLRVMNPTNGALHRAPLPIAIELGADVDPSTFRVTLNGVDVTNRFHSASDYSEARFALFQPLTSPLRIGSNSLPLEVEGDRETIHFTVIPTTNHFLRNIPFRNAWYERPFPVKERPPTVPPPPLTTAP